MGLVKSESYDELTEAQTLEGIHNFYNGCKEEKSKIETYSRIFWENCGWSKSSFLKITVGEEYSLLEIYRDENFQGNYSLRYTQLLSK